MPVTAAALQVLVGADIKGALSGMKQVSAGVAALAKTGGRSIPVTVDAKGAHAGIAQVRSGLDGLTKVALGVGAAVAGLAALAAAPRALAGALGVDLAVELENIQAMMTGITKSGPVTAAILARVREEADATPFGFQELAAGTAALLPISKQTGIGYMTLLKQAELLAAVNPAEGLKGGVFALREALSGDFVSLQDRFNIPREAINRLKKQGLPALKIVERALSEMGIDSSLIDAQAKTFTGRLSTFKDAIDGIKVEAGKPILAALTGEIERFTGVIGVSSPQLKAWAATLGTNIAGKIRSLGELLATVLVTAQNIAKTHNLGLPEAVLTSLELRIGELFGPGAQGAFHGLVDTIKGLPATLGKVTTFFTTDFPAAIGTVQGIAAEITAAIKGMVAELRASIAALFTDLVEANIPGVSAKFKPAAERLRADANFPAMAWTPSPTNEAARVRAGIGGAVSGAGAVATSLQVTFNDAVLDSPDRARQVVDLLADVLLRTNHAADEAAPATVAGQVGS